MATQIFKNGFVSINGNDLSSDVQSVEISRSVEQQDDTTMGDNTRSVKGGLKGWSATVTFVQDFANAALDSILDPLVGTTVPIIVRPDAGAVSTSNPNYSGNALVASYNPIGGSVGDLNVCTVELIASKGSGDADLDRTTA